jgi:hypothetical protein
MRVFTPELLDELSIIVLVLLLIVIDELQNNCQN